MVGALGLPRVLLTAWLLGGLVLAGTGLSTRNPPALQGGASVAAGALLAALLLALTLAGRTVHQRRRAGRTAPAPTPGGSAP